MDPSGPSSTSTTSGAPQALRPWKGTAVFDTVKVAADTFRSILFMKAEARREFTREQRAQADKPQKTTREGVPLWSVQVAAVSWRGKTELINITGPRHDDPGSKFNPGDPVEFAGLVFGVTPKREGGYVTWCSADSLAAAV
jgi:hypothetical protein